MFFLFFFHFLLFLSDFSNYKATPYDFISVYFLIFQILRTVETEAHHAVLRPPLGRTRSSSPASLVTAARFPPLAARWSPSMRRERQIHIRGFPLTFHWLPQPHGLRAELLLEPVRTVVRPRGRRACFRIFWGVEFIRFILKRSVGGRTPQQF